MREAIDMVGVQCGRLTVIARAPRKGTQKGAFWDCLCTCGNHTVVKGHTLREAKTLSCGCLHRERMVKMGHAGAIDLTGKRSGKLVAIHSLGEGKNRKVFWLCQCDCGNTVEVKVQLFREGKVQSCGCLNRQPITGPTQYVHGHARRGLVTPTHSTWANMLRRCTDLTNNAYHHYGGRGIQVCGAWFNFENFLADMGEKPAGLSIERIDNNGNYEPGNCKWATQHEQMQNTRMIRRVTFNGETLRVREWSHRLNVSENTLNRRLRELPIDEAMDVSRPAPTNKPAICMVCGKLVNVSRDGLLWWHRNGRQSVCLGYLQQ